MGWSERRACGLMVLNRRTWQYRGRAKNDAAIRQRLEVLAQQRRGLGAPRLHVLLCREGIRINHKRTERIYREDGLTLAKRRRFRKRTGAQRKVLQPTTRADERWSMDFVADNLTDGRRLKILTIVDDHTRVSDALSCMKSATNLAWQMAQVGFTSMRYYLTCTRILSLCLPTLI